MNGGKKEENSYKNLEERFDHVYQNIYNTYIIGYDIQYMFNADDVEYHEVALTGYPLIDLFREALMSHFCLKLSIILEEKGDYSFLKYIRRLQIEYRALNNPILTLKDLENIESEIIESKNSIPIKTILHFRNKYYAHIDKNAHKTDLRTVQEDVLPYLERYKEMSELVSTDIFNVGRIDPPKHLRPMLILEHLSNYHHIDELINKVKYSRENKTISLSELESCMKNYLKQNVS